MSARPTSTIRRRSCSTSTARSSTPRPASTAPSATPSPMPGSTTPPERWAQIIGVSWAPDWFDELADAVGPGFDRRRRPRHCTACAVAGVARGPGAQPGIVDLFEQAAAARASRSPSPPTRPRPGSRSGWSSSGCARGVQGDRRRRHGQRAEAVAGAVPGGVRRRSAPTPTPASPSRTRPPASPRRRRRVSSPSPARTVSPARTTSPRPTSSSRRSPVSAWASSVASGARHGLARRIRRRGCSLPDRPAAPAALHRRAARARRRDPPRRQPTSSPRCSSARASTTPQPIASLPGGRPAHPRQPACRGEGARRARRAAA